MFRWVFVLEYVCGRNRSSFPVMWEFIEIYCPGLVKMFASRLTDATSMKVYSLWTRI
jgi:hypothetical protein